MVKKLTAPIEGGHSLSAHWEMDIPLDFGKLIDAQLVYHSGYRIDDKRVLCRKFPALVVLNGQFATLVVVALGLVRIIFLHYLEFL